MTNSAIYLIKFDLRMDINEYYYYQLLTKDSVIIEKYGKVGFEHLYQVYCGDLEKFNSLVNRKIFEGYKELQVIKFNENYTQLVYKYDTKNKVSGSIIFDSEEVENFVKSMANNTNQCVGLSHFVDCRPITSSYKTILGLVPELVIIKALEQLKKIDKVLKELADFREYNKEDLKNYLLDDQYNSSNIQVDKACFEPNKQGISSISKHLCDLVNAYFCLIPTSLESLETINLLLDKGMFVKVNQEICNLMLSYYSEVEMLKSIRFLNISDNDIKIELIAGQDRDFNKIFNLYKSGGYDSYTRVKNVFKVQIGEFNKRFENKANIIGNVQAVWHGTNRRNIASILINGFSLPGNLAVSTNGSSYGSGIYFSSASRKSIGYSSQWICSSPGSRTTTYLILASVAAGRYDTTGSYRYCQSGFNSVWVNKGGYNDELVVYSEDQAKVDYIVEIEKY